MSTSDEPPKLETGSDELGRLIRTANLAYEEPLDEYSAWRQFQTRHAQRQARDARRFYWGAAAIAAAAVCILVIRARAPERSFAISADPAVTEVPRRTPPAETEDVARVASIAPLSVVEAAAPQLTPASLARMVASSVESARAPVDCDIAVERGPARDAAACLEQRALGESLYAQRALYDLALLKQKRLRDPAGALASLRSYRKRFPDGALKGEVDFALVELLPKLGQAKEAMRESEALLQTPWGRTRSSELRLMRGRLSQVEFGDCEQALKEFAHIDNEFGAIGDEAILRSAQCLENRGKRDHAGLMYRKYLARPGISEASVAAERLKRLDSDNGS